MNNLQETLKNIFEEEMMEGGKLEDLKKVMIGDFKLLSHKAYPALAIFLNTVTVKGDARKVEMRINIKLEAATLSADTESSFARLEDLIWKDTDSGPKGLIPVLLDNLGIKANNQYYTMDMGTISFMQVAGNNRHFSTLAEIPITLKTWKNIT